MITRFSTSCRFVTGMAALLSGTSSFAQTNPDNDNGNDIVVTAQKRSQNLQDVAASIQAVSGEVLQERQITSVESLAQSMVGVNFGQTTGQARIAIRGIGFDNITVGNEGRIAYHQDGVFISRPAGATTGFYDIERVEVLRGPQGTLYGRNATGGAINVITRAPSQTTSGYINLTYGNYQLKKIEGAVGGPISSAFSARFSFRG